jgi:hypothetical protein
MPLLHFIKYNNAVPIAISLVLLGAGGTFAATDPSAIYSAQQQVVSVDNTYIANVDLSTYSPKAQITSVTEDADNYYIAYTFYTIDVKDSVWQNVADDETMQIPKASLGKYDDLGLNVTNQLKQIVEREMLRLRQTQDEARQNISSKVVATTYGGLVGKFLDDKTETLPGYVPVVAPAPPQTQTAAAASSAQSGNSNVGGNAAGGSSLLSLQLLGDNPANVELHASYIDLGVVLQDPSAPNLGYHAFVDGAPEDNPSIDTSVAGAHTIEYRATDQNGAVVVVRRVVLVGGAPDPGGEISSAGDISGNSAAPQSPSPQTLASPPPAQNTPGGSQSGSDQSTTPPSSTSTSTPEQTSSGTSTVTTTPPDTSATSSSGSQSGPVSNNASSTPPTPDTNTASSTSASSTNP